VEARVPDGARGTDAAAPRGAETLAIHAAHQEVIKLLYMGYWRRCTGAASDADKPSAALLFRGSLNAASIARDLALSLLPGI
jgi:hypothetical protein